MIIKLYNEQPNARLVQQVVSVLEKGGIIIYPTDTVYGIGCDITNPKAIEKIYKIRGLDPKKAHLSFICYDLTDISQYTKPFNTKIFRIVKRALPGPYTFIFNATTQVPKLLSSKKKTVGIRVPDNNIIREIVKQLGRPIVTTSIRDDDDIIEYSTDPELIHEKYENTVDLVIDGGYGDNTPSTVVDVSSGDVEVIREGKGEVNWMF
ncbi:MAG TPA: threonylcarbamoyl-AMP synthase [Candidatus Sphingobacterium stercoripullorum]|uniref:Threonylcarbamoyl-AMP synthase n=1 Tax=Candidatus Sphingobacterium stercoripullorum TaxID=2838759 RepID=A0A9D1W7J7_9SPHI|nr:threonylcarbamoyl-AMP synthase [Candidatus Sphingobacterium stercoripullorum]